MQKRSKVCHAYRVNRLKELVEIWHVDGVTIAGVHLNSGQAAKKGSIIQVHYSLWELLMY